MTYPLLIHQNLLLFITQVMVASTHFPQNLLKHFNEKGYPVISFNCLKTSGNQKLLSNQLLKRSTLSAIMKVHGREKQVVLIGYSFGADIVPFIFTRLSKKLSETM